VNGGKFSWQAIRACGNSVLEIEDFFHVILCIFGNELLVELSCRKMKNCVNVVYGDGMNWGVVWV